MYWKKPWYADVWKGFLAKYKRLPIAQGRLQSMVRFWKCLIIARIDQVHTGSLIRSVGNGRKRWVGKRNDTEVLHSLLQKPSWRGKRWTKADYLFGIRVVLYRRLGVVIKYKNDWCTIINHTKVSAITNLPTMLLPSEILWKYRIELFAIKLPCVYMPNYFF